MCEKHSPIQCILPPYVLDRMVDSKDPKIRKIGTKCLAADAAFRAVRQMLTTLPAMSAIPSPAGRKHRLVYDFQNKPVQSFPTLAPGKLVRSEGDAATGDKAADEAYNGSGYTYDFYSKIFERNSLDDRGMSLISSVHVGNGYDNAFWNGEQMAYGDGDGQAFLRFTKALDVIGHELTHGVVTHTSNLNYEGQSGALNEHFADVFGLLVRQWREKQNGKKDEHWHLGGELIGPLSHAVGIRTFLNMKAFEDDPVLGDDPQPKHMDDLYDGWDDNGGVHINSGIPNHAFYLTATRLGGNAWGTAGKIWYKTMLALTRTSEFQEAADKTVQFAAEFGAADVVRTAWKEVGITVAGATKAKRPKKAA